MKKSGVAFLAVLMMAMSACYGPFNLTRKLYKFNGQIGTRWVNEAAFVGMAVFPVYFFATLGDAIIFNSIEFWGGKNPVTAENTRSIQQGDEQAVLHYDASARRLRVDEFQKGRHESTVVIKPSTDGMAAYDAQGRLLMSAKTVGGQLVLADASGRTIKTQDAIQLP